MQLSLPFSASITLKNEGQHTTATAEEGISRASENANDQWVTRAKGRIEYIAHTHEFLNADDLDDDMSRFSERTHDKRASGAIFVWARRKGIIEPTSTFTPSRNPKNHKCPRRTWKSLLYKPFSPQSHA